MKQVLKTLLLLVVYFVLAGAPSFLGFASPVLWVYYPVISAFLAATPVLMAGSRWPKFGAVCIFGLLFAVLGLAMGELAFVDQIAPALIGPFVAELVRLAVGYRKQLGLRLAYAIVALAPVWQIIIIWTRTDFYYANAVTEMGSQAYADGLLAMATPLNLVVVIVLTLVAGYLGALVSEKLFKNKVTLA